MFGNIHWCDVDSDDEFCIPDLPPLPPIKSLSFPFAVIEKEEQTSLSSVRESETSKPCSSTGDQSEKYKNEEHITETFLQLDCGNSRENKEIPAYVCFIGKLPHKTTITELTQIVSSMGINYTDLRMGPKKKPNALVFGYVDLPSRYDYEKLLALDGILYKGRRLRIDHATRDTFLTGRKVRARNVTKVAGFDTRRQEICQPKMFSDHQVILRLMKTNSINKGKDKKKMTPEKSRKQSKPYERNKVTSRSRRYRMMRNNQRRGRRN